MKNEHRHRAKKSDGKNVRPISLISCLCKLFESMLKNKLQWWLECNGYLPKKQTGFRKGQSTVDNLVKLTLDIGTAFRDGKDILAAFLDASAAFDNVDLNILLDQLALVGCRDNVINFVKFITFERIIFTDSTGDNRRLVHKGVPQGDVLI